MPVDGHFRTGSDTKTFVAVVVLQLVGEGRIGLDHPVARWLPGLIAGNGNDERRITVRQVLQHTSGLPNYTEGLPALATAEGCRAHRFYHCAGADLVALAMRHPPLFAPGTHWGYSNTNYFGGMSRTCSPSASNRVATGRARRYADHPTHPRPASSTSHTPAGCPATPRCCRAWPPAGRVAASWQCSTAARPSPPRLLLQRHR
jgi:hypothetical protein